MKMNEIDWPTSLFLILTPILAVILTPIYLLYSPLQWQTVAFAIFLYFATSMGITAGYHRLFAHKGYKAKAWLRALYLLLGGAAFQGSALKWSTDHRRHHQKVDSNDDPYSIRRGFFFAHVGWLFLKDDPRFAGKYAEDLKRDKMIWFQHRYYPILAFFSGLVLPAFIGWFWNDLAGAFIFAGLIRVVAVHHGTFFINSLCHMWGDRPFSDRVSARDNFVLALLTNGEGYHNFHHTFAADYRNGFRWYHWDPTKWFIKTCHYLGQTYSLKKVPDSMILKYKIQMQEKIMLQKGAPSEKLELLKKQVEQAQIRLKEIKEEYKKIKANIHESSSAKYIDLRHDLRLEIRRRKYEFKRVKAQWNAYFESLHAHTV